MSGPVDALLLRLIRPIEWGFLFWGPWKLVLILFFMVSLVLADTRAFRIRDNYFPIFNPFSLHVVIVQRATSFGFRIFKAVSHALVEVLRFTKAKFLKFMSTILSILGVIWNMDKLLLAKGTERCYQMGLLGNLIHIPFSLSWMFWPLAVPFLTGSWWWLIPTLFFSSFLLIHGWDVIAENWSEPVDETAPPALVLRSVVPTILPEHGLVLKITASKKEDWC